MVYPKLTASLFLNLIFFPFYTDIIFHSLKVELTRNIHPTKVKSSGPSFLTSVTTLVSILNSWNNLDNEAKRE
jgi:hypothetical protein